MQNQTFSFISLELIDFMRFDHFFVDFAKDLTVIVGKNGSGKSAILEAIALSFQVKEKTSSVQNYIRKGKDFAKINLKCLWLGKELEISSIFATAGSRRITRVVRYDNQEYLNTQANNYLSEFFKNLSIGFAMQGNEKFLSTSKATNLANLVNLLQLDFGKELSYTRGKIQELEKEKVQALNEINKKQGSQEILQSNIQTLNQKIDQSLQALNILQKEICNISEVNEEIKNIQDKLAPCYQVRDTRTALDKQRQEASQDLTKKENDLKDTVQQLLNIPEMLSPIDEKDIGNQIEDQEKICNDLQVQFENDTQFLVNLKKERAVIESKLLDEKNRKKRLEEDHICPTCLQPITDKCIADLDSTINQFLQNLEDNKNKEIDISSIKQQLDIEKAKLQTLKQQANDLKIKQNEIENKNAYNAKLKDHLSQLREKLEEDVIKSKKVYEEILEKCKTEIKDRLVDISSLEEELNNLINQRDLELKRQTQSETQTNLLTDYKNSLKNTENDLCVVKANIQELEQSLKDFSIQISKHSKMQEIFSMLPKLHLNSFLGSIQTACTEIVINFGYKGVIIEKDEKGVMFYLQNYPLQDTDSADIPYDMCSSFERNLMSLSLIYTLTRMFRTPLVCIDELDSSADEDNTSKLGNLIKLILQHTCVVTVSHDSSLVEKLLQDSTYESRIIRTSDI